VVTEKEGENYKRRMQCTTMEVGWMARSLMQESLVLPAAGQLPQ